MPKKLEKLAEMAVKLILLILMLIISEVGGHHPGPPSHQHFDAVRVPEKAVGRGAGPVRARLEHHRQVADLRH